MNGFGDLVRIDLSGETVTVEQIPLALRRRYLGGEGINSWLLWEHFLHHDPKSDPRGPDNVLIVGLGPLGGTPFGLGSKTKFTFKSPAYGLFGDSTAGGGFGPTLRWAGHDHLVITGRARRPVYLSIDDDRITFHDAALLWGKNTSETNRLIRHELGTAEMELATIGRAGENSVGFASITVSDHRAAGRTGGGCVMGSKNLKAIAVRGTKGIAVADTRAFLVAMDDLVSRLKEKPQLTNNWRRRGTLDAVDYLNVIHANAYRNGQLSSMPEEAIHRINGDAYTRDLMGSSYSCSPGCATACSAWHRVRGVESVAAKHFPNEEGLKPEYLTIASLGIGTDIRDLPAVLHLNKLCTEYGLDVVEMGNAISFLMECRQRGVLDDVDRASWLRGPENVEWGNWEAAAEIIEAVGTQRNELGKLFRDSVYRAAQQIESHTGRSAVQYVSYGKGGATLSEDQRPFPGWACNIAVSARGADHLRGLSPLEKAGRKDISMAWFGKPDAGEVHGVSLKGAASARAENINCVVNASGICLFMPTRDSLIFGLDALEPALSALTGVTFAADELYEIGERICNVEKAFNSRLGLSRADDKLCDRWMNVPAPDGPGKGMKAADYLAMVLDEYYDWRGWDKTTGLQKREQLAALGLEDIAEVLAREGVLIE
ncbi:MAG: hypothetical protein EPO21_02380 [Chloroflexota bacterium]|nr:MAG: hypothetical protein EPO21_02380 [Chloroflexota bacterium]